MAEACELQAQGLRAYISGKSQVPMLQLINYIAFWQIESSLSQKSSAIICNNLFIYREAY